LPKAIHNKVRARTGYTDTQTDTQTHTDKRITTLHSRVVSKVNEFHCEFRGMIYLFQISCTSMRRRNCQNSPSILTRLCTACSTQHRRQSRDLAGSLPREDQPPLESTCTVWLLNRNCIQLNKIGLQMSILILGFIKTYYYLY